MYGVCKQGSENSRDRVDRMYGVCMVRVCINRVYGVCVCVCVCVCVLCVCNVFHSQIETLVKEVSALKAKTNAIETKMRTEVVSPTSNVEWVQRCVPKLDGKWEFMDNFENEVNFDRQIQILSDCI